MAWRSIVILAAIALGLAGCTKRPRKHVERPVCVDDRIRKVYATSGSLLLPETTTIEVETFGDALVGEAKYSFAVRADEEAAGEATLAPAESCAAGSAACQKVTCVGIGGLMEHDPASGLPIADVRVEVTVEDATCRETEAIWIECLEASDEQTCNICIGLIDPFEAAMLSSPCLGPMLLEQPGHSDNPSAQDCMSDESCLDLWRCQQATLCHLPAPYGCYCGELADARDCKKPRFEAKGPCEAEVLAAYEGQFLEEPDNNLEVLQSFFNVSDAPSGFASMATANALATHCLRPDQSNGLPTTRQLLKASGVSDRAIEVCMDACFPQ